MAMHICVTMDTKGYYIEALPSCYRLGESASQVIFIHKPNITKQKYKSLTISA